MTKNADMSAEPKEMATEVIHNHNPARNAGIARKRMANICATPEEVALYRYAPNAARENRHPGMPIEDYPVDD